MSHRIAPASAGYSPTNMMIQTKKLLLLGVMNYIPFHPIYDKESSDVHASYKSMNY